MNPYLMPVIEFGPKVIERLFRQIPTSRWDEPLVPDRFTPREVLAHFADWEPIMLQRMQTACRTPGATIEVYDEGQMAEEHGYRNLDPLEQMQAFTAQRATTAAWLRMLSGDDWTCTVIHPERGVQTVEDQANLLLGHDLYHIEQLSAYLEG